MKYSNINDLFEHSPSSRKYFESLPVTMQATLGEYGSLIHTESKLRRAVDFAQKNKKKRSVCENLAVFFGNS